MRDGRAYDCAVSRAVFVNVNPVLWTNSSSVHEHKSHAVVFDTAKRCSVNVTASQNQRKGSPMVYEDRMS